MEPPAREAVAWLGKAAVVEGRDTAVLAAPSAPEGRSAPSAEARETQERLVRVASAAVSPPVGAAAAE